MRKITFLFITIFLFVITSSTQAQKTLQVVISDTIGIPCNGGTGSATALASDGIVPYTYLWLPDSNTGPIDSNLVGGTTYTIMAIDADSNSAFTYLTLTQPTQIVITIDSLRNVKCPGDCIGFARITASGGIPPYKYLWLPDGDTTTVDSNMCSGNYTVLVTDSNGCSVKIPLTINTLSELSASTAATNVSCFGLFNGATAATETGGVPPYQFVWSPGGATTASVMGLSAGTYTVTITDALGCHTQSTAGVSQPTPIVLTAAAIANIAAAYVSGGTAPYTYNWYPHVSTTSIATGLSAGVYTVTVHDANLCSDSAIVSVSSLYPLLLYFGNGTTSCGKASYYDFDVMASSASQNNFNNCVVDIQYPMSEFGGDNVSNGGVTVTQGLDCLYSIGDNDYNILNTVNLSDSVIEITFGSDTAVSPRGSDPFNHIRLLHVKLRIRNSCGTGPISFVNTSYTDTTGYSSLIFPDTVCHNCALPCDSFGRYCCNYDSLGNFTDSCYHGYSCSDSVILRGGNYNYGIVSYGNDIADFELCHLTIDWNYTNPINAGTNAMSVPPISSIPHNSSIFIIPGSGFGSSKGRIKVSDANQDKILGITLDSSDILLWTDTLIKVKMPSYVFNNTALTPGSGPFMVYNTCGDSAGNNVQINYNILNYAPYGVKLRPDIVMVNDTESLKFRCDTSITNNPAAYACVKKAIREWNCYTGVNWKLGPLIILDTTRQDSISVIYFSYNNLHFPGPATVMLTTSWYLPCTNLPDSMAFTNEADIMIRANNRLPYRYTWNYDTTTNVLPDTVLSFYDLITHELGHAHGMGHIHDTNSVMWWIARPGKTRAGITTGNTWPAPASLLGGLDMVYTSATYSPLSLCSLDSILIPCPRNCIDPTLSVPDILENSNDLKLFPNPANSGDITIAYTLKENAYVQFKVYDCIGKEVIKMTFEHKTVGNYSERINVANLAKGVYLFTANINGDCQTIKFIKT